MTAVRLTWFGWFGVLILPGGSDALPIDSLYARGDSSINIVWIPDSANTRPFWYVRCCPADSNYRRCDFLPGVSYRGEAYSYGGEDPWWLFRERLSRGALVGSHDCHYRNCGDPSDSVTGTDCSGFVCYLWGVRRVSTSVLATSAAYVTVARTDLRPGDVLVKAGSHALVVVEMDDYPEILVWESYGWPVNGCRERLINLNDAYWSTYVGRRNPQLTAVREHGKSSGRRVVHARMAAEALYTLRGSRVCRVAAGVSGKHVPGVVIVFRDAVGRVCVGRGDAVDCRYVR